MVVPRPRCRSRRRLALRGSARRRCCRRALADRLAVVDADHHDDEFRLFGRDDFARNLRPFGLAAGLVTDEARGGAMLAHNAEFRLLGERVLEAVGEPIGHGVAHHHDWGGHWSGGVRLLTGGRRRMRVVRRCFALALAGCRPVFRLAEKAAAERIVVRLLIARLLSRKAPVAPELGIRRHQQRQRHAERGDGPGDRSDGRCGNCLWNAWATVFSAGTSASTGQ